MIDAFVANPWAFVVTPERRDAGDKGRSRAIDGAWGTEMRARNAPEAKVPVAYTS